MYKLSFHSFISLFNRKPLPEFEVEPVLCFNNYLIFPRWLMFYLWLIGSALLMLSIFAQIFMLFYGVMPNITSLALNFGLEAVMISMAYRKYKEPHETSYPVLCIGSWIVIIGFLLFIQRSGYLSLSSTIRTVECSFLIITCGLALIMYNRKEVDKEEDELSQSEPDELNTNIFEVIFDIEQILHLKTCVPGSESAKSLMKCEAYLSALEQKGYPVSKAILNQISEILWDYYSLSLEPIKTEKCQASLRMIESSFPQLEQALGRLYDLSCSEQLESADIRVKALETNLKVNGLLNSDFDITEQNDLLE